MTNIVNIEQMETEQKEIGAVSSLTMKKSGSLLKYLVEGFEEYAMKFNNWADFAVQMENSDEVSQVARRLEYNFNQKCSQAWLALYGNRTQEQVQRHEGVEGRIRFCASENFNYWESVWETTKDEEDGIWGPSNKKANAAVRFEEARLNWEMCMAEYELWSNMYGLVTGQAFTYKPFTEHVERPMSDNNKSLAAKLMASKSQLIKKQA